MNHGLCKSFDFPGATSRLLTLFKDEPYLFFLDSSLNDHDNGRYSFIGFDPFDVFQSDGKDSLLELKKKFIPFQEEFKDAPTPLPAGIVGFLSYDYGLKQENIAVTNADGLTMPGCLFGFYDCMLTIDHYLSKLYITSTGFPEKNDSLREKRAAARLDYILGKLDALSSGVTPFLMQGEVSKDNTEVELKCNFTKEHYVRCVEKALDYIGRGEVYQVNLSQRFHFDAQGYDLDPIKVYESLRALSPAHFCSYFNTGNFQIISSSPERFLQLKGNRVQTRPMKGTRPRGENGKEDKKFKDEIIHSRKDKAELLMITDLERNDLGRVCAYGSVKVRQMRTIEEYETVFQATSTVEGALQEGKDGFDLLRACFPGGSITGCPKIRAMEIIDELEPTRRGIYTGSLGYMSFTGDMDFNILIRTLVAYEDGLYFQVGGGIVADSNPESEYKETLVKAKAIRQCLADVFRPVRKENSNGIRPLVHKV